MVKTKANQKIHIDKLKTTLDKLGQLKEKPKEELTLRESIYFLRDKIKSALKKGYSYQDLSGILEEQGILISASTLKQYLTDITKQSTSRRKRTKSGQSKTSNSEDTASSDSSAKEDKDKTSSKSQSDTDLSKDVNTSKEKSDKDLNKVQSDTVIESPMSNTKQESVTSRSKSRITSKNKAKKLSGSNQDLSSDFNQY
ncbi:MAG: hypothetical protein QNJ60_05280 [Xenococcaceae cyanobacterium MO_188.B19]|nr:hypothetical protein [Xenococcaceae cyanobacterium MO_188.B19]